MNRRTFVAAAGAAAAANALPAAAVAAADNPFLVQWRLPNGAPPFDLIRTEHFLPAFERGMAERRAEIDAIATARARPTFKNTIEAMERGGDILGRVSNVFFNRTSAHTDPAIQKIQAEIAPRLSAFNNETVMNAALFERVEAVHEGRA